MEWLPVQVCASGSDPTHAKGDAAPFCVKKDGRTTVSTSGIKILINSSQYVISPASLALPFLVPDKRRSPAGACASHVLPVTRITCHNTRSSSQEIPSDELELVHVLEVAVATDVIEGVLRAANRVSNDPWTTGWATNTQSNYVPLRAEQSYASWLAVFAVKPLPTSLAWSFADLTKHLSQLTTLLPATYFAPSQPIILTGSPFGCVAPEHFTNFQLQGSISTPLHPTSIVSHPPHIQDPHHTKLQPCPPVAIIDAQALPGMEGAAVTTPEGTLLGLLTLPLRRQSTHLQLLLTLPAILTGLQTAEISHPYPPTSPELATSTPSSPTPRPPAPHTPPSLPPTLTSQPTRHQTPLLPPPYVPPAPNPTPPTLHPASSIVLIQNGSSWATGVILTPSGIILTNAHLFPRPPTGPPPRASLPPIHVTVRLPALSPSAAPQWLPATVLYIFTGYLDIALLQLSPGAHPYAHQPRLLPGGFKTNRSHSRGHLLDGSRLTSIQLHAGAISAGMPILVVGHGLFGPSCGVPPLVTRGGVTKVLQVEGKASMLITSAAVHSGMSGGAVLAPDGRLVGLVTSNARHAKGDVLPHLNFSIASEELRPVWSWAAAVGPGVVDEAAVDVLRRLDGNSDEGHRVWALSPGATPRPPQKQQQKQQQGTPVLQEMLNKKLREAGPGSAVAPSLRSRM